MFVGDAGEGQNGEEQLLKEPMLQFTVGILLPRDLLLVPPLRGLVLLGKK